MTENVFTYEKATQLYSSGSFPESLECLDFLIENNSSSADYWHLRAIVKLSLCDFQNAYQDVSRAIQLESNHSGFYNTCGLILEKLNQQQEALNCFEKASQLNPNDDVSLNNLGIVSHLIGMLLESTRCFEKAVALQPKNVDYLRNYGAVLQEIGRPEESVQACIKALAIRPSYAEVLSNLSFSLQQTGRISEGLDAANKALALQPDAVGARWHRALALLTLGEFAEGFKDYECRIHHPALQKMIRKFTGAQAEWNGEVYKDLRLHVFSEQGLGDAIQFVRYLQILTDFGVRVCFEVQQELIELFLPLQGIQFIPLGTTPPEFDSYVSNMSLPFKFKTTIETIPSRTPYLTAPKHCFDIPYNSDKPFKIGLVWAGNSSHSANIHRSVSARDMSIFSTLEKVSLYNFQMNASPECLGYFGSGISDLTPHFKNFSHTAYAVSQMHLIITVDTAIAHLAGALGIPCWVALSKAVDWRWQNTGESSHWYSSLKLFRQKNLGNWQPVFEEMYAHLKSFSHSN